MEIETEPFSPGPRSRIASDISAIAEDAATMESLAKRAGFGPNDFFNGLGASGIAVRLKELAEDPGSLKAWTASLSSHASTDKPLHYLPTGDAVPSGGTAIATGRARAQESRPMHNTLPSGDTTLSLQAANTQGPSCRLKVTAHGLTDRGRVRQRNEDQFLVARLAKSLRIMLSSLPQKPELPAEEEGHVFVVADGVGGAAGGKEASATALLSLEDFLLNTFKWFYRLKGPERASVVAEFQSALRFAETQIQAKAEESPDLRGMGTTLTMAYSRESRMFVAHAGDSRCYLLRNQTLHKITRDHTLMAELLKQGAIQPEQVHRHPLRTMITNSLGGTSREVKADVHKLGIEPGDVFLLCTDGLTEAVSEQEIAGILTSVDEPRDACERLVARANDLGGRDNITVVVWTYTAEG